MLFLQNMALMGNSSQGTDALRRGKRNKKNIP
jgi:hypothetical protein